MNDSHLPDDDVLRLVFGELDAERRAEVRKAVAEDAEQAATVRGLESVVAAVRAENVGQVSEQFNDRLRQRMSEGVDHARPETTCPTFVTRSLTKWRWIMRSPVSRAAAAVVFVFALVGASLWFHGGGTASAFAEFAEFIEPMRDAKSVKYKITVEIEGLSGEKERIAAAAKEGFISGFEKSLAAQLEKGLSAKAKERLFAETKGLSSEMQERLSIEVEEGRLSAEMMRAVSAEMMKKLSAQLEKVERDEVAKINKLLPGGRLVTTYEVMTLGSTRKRTEQENPDGSKTVTITDRGQGKRLTLYPKTKEAKIHTLVKRSEGSSRGRDIDPLASLFSMVLHGALEDHPSIGVDALGEEEIDGRRVVGFRVTLSEPASVQTLWGDPETGLPVRIDITTALPPSAKATVSDFEVNVDMDESLFSVEPPVGYEIIEDPDDKD